MATTLDDWRGCYNHGWGKADLVPDAFSHPAKMAKGLCFRIVEHCIEEGWIGQGGTVLDPFGGVATIALPLLTRGINYVGIELEEKFVRLANENIALWNSKYGGKLPKWGEALLLQGDSRKLLTWQFAGPKAEAVVGSPPFLGARAGTTASTETSGGGPCADRVHTIADGDRLGTSPGQLAAMPEGNVDAVIASPPFSPDQPCASQTRAKKDYHAFTRGDGTKRDHQMISPDQLGKMREGAFDGVVSSPPWADVEPIKDKKFRPSYAEQYEKVPYNQRGFLARSHHPNLASFRNCTDTFWSASRQILEQVFLAVRSGGYCVWVVKEYVRKGKLVDFPGQWQQLCEAVGFVTVHEHRAWLTENQGTQVRTDGGETRLVKQRKSFFRRLAERKGSPRIDWETVLCMQRE